MRPLTLVFDLDGTLLDSAPDLIGTLNVILLREGAAALPVEKAGSVIGGGARALLERGFAASGVTLEEPRLAALYAQFLDHYGAHLADESRLFDGAAAALAAFRRQGHVLAICTNKITAHSDDLVRLMGLDGVFSAVCGRDAFAYFKPDARHLTLTIERAGGDLARAIMIGDSITDVTTAKNAGVPSIVVDFGYTDIPARELGATAVISHFDDLAAAVEAIAAGFEG